MSDCGFPAVQCYAIKAHRVPIFQQLGYAKRESEPGNRLLPSCVGHPGILELLVKVGDLDLRLMGTPDPLPRPTCTHATTHTPRDPSRPQHNDYCSYSGRLLDSASQTTVQQAELQASYPKRK